MESEGHNLGNSGNVTLGGDGARQGRSIRVHRARYAMQAFEAGSKILDPQATAVEETAGVEIPPLAKAVQSGALCDGPTSA